MTHATDQSDGSWRPVSRRAFLRGAAGAGAGMLAMPIVSSVLAQQAGSPPPAASSASSTSSAAPSATTGSPAQPPHFRTYPIPGTLTASPSTEISFRGPEPAPIGTVTVVGSHSGNHSGVLIPHSDGYGASFVPDAAFQPGEEVTVSTSLDLRNGTNGTIKFTVATPIIEAVQPSTRQVTNETPTQNYHSRPDLKPPVFQMTDTGKTARGSIMIAPKTPTSQNGALILDNNGQTIWFMPLSNEASSINDFREQRYKGRPVLTWWEGISATGHGLGHYQMVDQTYKPMATLQIANGFRGGDLHEFLITPQDTALYTAYDLVKWDLTPVGGAPDGIVMDGIVQELDIETGRVLFEWHSLDHITLAESYVAPSADNTSPYDYFHINSIDVDQDRNLIVSGRHTSAIYKVDHVTGDVIWRLNGKASNFQMGEGTVTAFQHDARILASGNLTVFDNSSDGKGTKAPGVATRSRGIEMALDQTAMTATLVAQYIHPGTVLGTSQGNMEVLPNGNVFIGWGSEPYFSEFSSDGKLVLDGKLPDKSYSYRAYRSVWSGYPTDTPAVAAEPAASGGLTVYASWNGATQVAAWDVLAGADPEQLKAVGSAARDGFETAIPIKTTAAYVAVRATSKSGEVLGVSKAIKTTA